MIAIKADIGLRFYKRWLGHQLISEEFRMSSIKSWLLEQFPGYDPHIHRLWGTYDGIEDKSHDYFELQSKVSKLDRTAELGELALSRQ